MSFTTLRSIYDFPTIAFDYRWGRMTVAREAPPREAPSAALNQRISLVHQDITTLSLDAIMNAANTELRPGGGVDGDIHLAAGRGLAEECSRLFANGCPVGSSVVTGAHNLPCKFVIHAVSPRRQVRFPSPPGSPIDYSALESCYTSCLRQADDLGCESLGLCCLGTGAYGFPKEQAAGVACAAVRRHLEATTESTLKRVVFVVYSVCDLDIYRKWIP